MTDKRDDIADDEALDGDRAGGWAGVPEALSEAVDRGAGSDQGESPIEDETPGSQGEIEAGSEGDFGNRDR
jgi:hypothetical protein